MAIFDRIRDTTTTTATLSATTTFTVSGSAPSGFQTFSARFVSSPADSNIPVVIAHQTLNEWQVAWCSYTASNTLRVDTIIASSNSDNGVAFSAGTKDVFVANSSKAIAALREANTFTGNNTFPNTGLKVQDTDASHVLTLASGALTANRTLTLTTGSAADRTLDISAANVTISTAGAALIDDADAAAQRTTLGLAIGTNVQAYDADLAALAGLSTNGMLARTGAGTAAVRTITAGSNISVANGDGVSGNPTIAFSGDLPFSSLAQGSALSVLGVTGNATADVASIAAGTDHQVLRRSGTAVGFGSVALNQSAAITGTLPVGNGGTGASTLTGVVKGTGTSALTASAIVTADIGNDEVTYAKIQNVSATDRLLGRSTAGAGDVEEITCTAAGRDLLDDADAADQRTTLGLGTIATQDASNVTISGGSATGLTTLSAAEIKATTTSAAGHLADTTGTGSGGFFVGGANGLQYTGVRLFADGAANWAVFQTGKAENPTELSVYPNASQGYATTNSGTNGITRVSGTNFSSSWVGKTLYFLRKKFTVASVTPPDTLTVTEIGGAAVTFPGTETEAYNYFYTSGSGLCNVSGSTVTWVSGDPFVPLFLTDFEFTLNGTPRTVSTFDSVTQYTLSAAPGNGTNVPFTWRGNINDQLATLRVQAILGTDEENVNVKAIAGNNTFGRYYSLTSNIAGNGKYRPIYIGTGEFSDATFHHQIGCTPRNYAGATSDGYVSLGGVLGRDALRVFGPSTSTAYANRLEVFGAATTSAPNIRARGSDTNVTLGYDTQGTGAHVFTSGAFGRTNFKIYGSNGADYLITDASTGNPYLAIEGSSTNASLRLRAKGTGGVVLSEHADNNVTVTGASGSSAPVIAVTSSNTDVPLQLQAKGTGDIDLYANASLQLKIGATGSAVNRLELSGGPTGFGPSFRTRGSDTNVALAFDTKGTGSFQFTSGEFGRTNFFIYGSAGNDHIAIDTATGAPAIVTAGSSSDRDLRLIAAGTGRVRFGTHTGVADTAISGYIEIKDDGGTTRKLAVIT